MRHTPYQEVPTWGVWSVRILIVVWILTCVAYDLTVGLARKLKRRYVPDDAAETNH